MSNILDNVSELNELYAKLESLDIDTKQLKELIQERNEEVRYYKDILFALDFVDFSRKLSYEGYDYSYYDYISLNMDRYKKENVKSRAVRLIDKENS